MSLCCGARTNKSNGADGQIDMYRHTRAYIRVICLNTQLCKHIRVRTPLSSYRQHAVISNELSPQLAFRPKRNLQPGLIRVHLTKSRWRLANFRSAFASGSVRPAIGSTIALACHCHMSPGLGLPGRQRWSASLQTGFGAANLH